MADTTGLTRESSETIGFVLTSLCSSAINLDELNDWCYHVIGQLELGQPPAYLFDLAEYKDSLPGIYRVLGFSPHWNGSAEDEAAIYGIATRRGAEPFDWPLEPDAALAALARNPALEAHFRQTFPFIVF
jgi:hypothetical protein